MYERYFNLRDQPFRLTPDPSDLYLGSKHREGFAHLLFAMREGSGFVAVTGEVGTGKTTLVRALLAETRNDNIAVGYIFNPVLSPTELLQTINAELGIPSRTTSKKQLIDALNRFLLAQKADGGRAVIIVDEAQNLDPEVLEQLRLLSNLETETEKLLQIILLGQPELRDLLDRPDLRQLSQRVAIRWQLDPLDRNETRKYVQHRLRVAGGEASLFDTRALDLLYEHSGGIPRLVNILAHRALLVGFTNGRPSVGADEVTAAAAELGDSRIPLKPVSPGWVYKAAAGAGVTVAAALVALLLVAPLRDDSTSAPLPPPVASKRSEPAPKKSAPPSDTSTTEVLKIEKRLLATDPFTMTATAASRLVELWTAKTPARNEIEVDALDVEALGSRRQLSYLGAALTPALLDSLDLPAIVELRTGVEGDTRFVLLEKFVNGMVVIRLDKPVSVSKPAFNKLWTGVAHLYWKDAESFRRELVKGQSGPPVTKLQTLLTEAGVLRVPPSGNYDDDTAAAVTTLQESYGLPADGAATPLTQIVLYNAAARFERPSLTEEAGEEHEKSR